MSDPVEAAARVHFDRIQAHRHDEGSRRPDGKRWHWDDLTRDDQLAYRAFVQPLVTAALAARDGGSDA